MGTIFPICGPRLPDWWTARGLSEGPRKHKHRRAQGQAVAGGRYWVRTSDLFGVNEARYHCANRPRWSTIAEPIAAVTSVGGSQRVLDRFACPPPVWLWLHPQPGSRMRADVAQLVEHHLAKVRVAGSNPVVRSERVSSLDDEAGSSPVEWPRGEATDCKSVYTGSNPVSTSGGWRSGSALP